MTFTRHYRAVPSPLLFLLASWCGALCLLLPVPTCRAFVTTPTCLPSGVIGGAAAAAAAPPSAREAVRASHRRAQLGRERRRLPSSVIRRGATSSSSTDSSPASAATASDSPPPHKFDSYDKPVVLIGLSSSPESNELERLAVSLSGAIHGGNDGSIMESLARLERSQGAGLLGGDDDDDDDDDNGGASQSAEASPSSGSAVTGISLSALGLDEEGPYVLDTQLISELISKGTLSLKSGVIVLDFNHAAFADEENEVDLIRALSSVAKSLYEREGLLSVYVNVQPDEGEGVMSEGVRRRKGMVEKEVLIPFSDYEVCIKNEGAVSSSSSSSMTWDDVAWELQRVVARALLPPPVVGDTAPGPNCADSMMGMNTFFLSLSFPKVEEASPYVERMCEDVDSMEYRVDLLQAAKDYFAAATTESDGGDGDESCKEKKGKVDSRFDILYQQQLVRAMCRPHAQRAPALPFAGSSVITDALPIVYTVRTANQAGTWPDDDVGIGHMFDLLELGLRSAAEVLDVESAWDATLTTELLDKAQERYTSLILGSHHVVGRQVDMDEAIELYRQCRIDDRAHGGKVVLSITSNDNDDDQLAHKASIAASKLDEPEIPNIGLVLGEMGSYSRILNPRFTPVTHESLPSAAAPGQLTAAEIMAARLLTGIIPSQRYAILGHNIAYSVSPQMQGAAFAAVKLPHVYTRADVEDVKDFVEGPIWNDENFGGASVTIPHKQNIIPHVDVLTDAAKEIGSVNTVIVKKDKFGTRVLIGENTDWRGIYNPLRRRLGDENDGDERQYALILGGGGTARAAAYAAAKLNLERIYYNRTPEKAEDLAEEFGGIVASSLDEGGDPNSLGSILEQSKGSVNVVISTLPAAAEFKLPEWMLANPRPIVFDVNYKPYNTELLVQATSVGCDVVRGSEMLWEQGVGQFELWTGRKAPYGVMKKVVLENCLPAEAAEDK